MARTAASAQISSLVTSGGPVSVSGLLRSHTRPATASPAAAQTMAALAIRTIPYVVVTRELSGTSTSAEITPVMSTSEKSHAAAVA